jgi:hypothetical protein
MGGTLGRRRHRFYPRPLLSSSKKAVHGYHPLVVLNGRYLAGVTDDRERQGHEAGHRSPSKTTAAVVSAPLPTPVSTLPSVPGRHPPGTPPAPLRDLRQ